MSVVHNLHRQTRSTDDGSSPSARDDGEFGDYMDTQPDGPTSGDFQLLALTTVRGGGRPVSWRHLGRHRDLEAAVRARVEDVLAQLNANDGWLINAQHLIVGPGADGPATLHSYISEVGADPGDDTVPSPHNEAAVRTWLLAAHSLRT